MASAFVARPGAGGPRPGGGTRRADRRARVLIAVLQHEALIEREPRVPALGAGAARRRGRSSAEPRWLQLDGGARSDARRPPDPAELARAHRGALVGRGVVAWASSGAHPPTGRARSIVASASAAARCFRSSATARARRLGAGGVVEVLMQARFLGEQPRSARRVGGGRVGLGARAHRRRAGSRRAIGCRVCSRRGRAG